jgi:hypothetical protein
MAIVLADETACAAQAQVHEPRIADHDALQAQKLLRIDRLATRLGNGAPPALHAILRSVLALDDVARLGVVEEEERGGTRKDVLRHLGNDLAGTFRDVHSDEAIQLLRAEHQRTELGRSRQVVLHAVPRRGDGARLPLQLRIEDWDVGSPRCIGKVEPLSEEPLVEGTAA